MRSRRPLPRRSRTLDLAATACLALALPSCFYLDHETTYETRTERRTLEEPRLEFAPRLVALPGDRLRVEAPAQRIERVETERWRDGSSEFELLFHSVTLSIFEDAEEGDELAFLIVMPFTLAWDLLLPVTGTFYNLGDWALSGGSELVEREELTETRAATPTLRLTAAPNASDSPLPFSFAPAADGAFELDLESLAAAELRTPTLALRGSAGQSLELPLAIHSAERLAELSATREPLPTGTRREVPPGTDLAALFTSTPAGTVLLLAPGVHELRGALELPDGVALCGASSSLTILRGASADACLTQRASKSTELRDLAVERGTSTAPALLELRGNARCARVAFRAENNGSAIAARDRAKLALQACRFHGCRESATTWSDDARGSVEACSFSACAAALKVGERAAPELGENEYGGIEEPIVVAWAKRN
jgi:hypothetical protein